LILSGVSRAEFSIKIHPTMNDAHALYQQPTEDRIALLMARDWREHLLTEQDRDISNMINGKSGIKIICDII